MNLRFSSCATIDAKQQRLNSNYFSIVIRRCGMKNFIKRATAQFDLQQAHMLL